MRMKQAVKYPRHNRRVILMIPAILIVACLLVWLPGFARAQGPGARGKVVVLVVDRVGADQFPSGETPFLSRLAEQWSVGLMVSRPGNIDTGKEADLGGEYVTLGSGFQARGTGDSRLCFDSDERFTGHDGTTEAGKVFLAYTGYEAPPGGVVCLGWQQVIDKNEGYADKGMTGLLGALLEESGLRAAVVGNADSYQRLRRLAPLICCDRDGIVPLGNVGPRNAVLSSGEVGNRVTNTGFVLNEFRRLLPIADLLVVDTGDTGRIDRETGLANQELLERQEREALQRVDDLAREISGLLDFESSILLVVSPGAPSERIAEGNFLTPFIAAGGGFEGGLLCSESTRRRGLVSNLDFLPTVLDFYDIEVPSDVIGSAMTTSKASGSLDYVKGLYNQLPVTRKVRWPIVIGYTMLAFIMLALMAISGLAARGRLRWPRRPEKLARLLSAVAVVLLSAPLSFLVVSVFRYSGYLFPALFCTAFSIVLGLGAWFFLRRRGRLGPVVFICLVTGTVLLVDLFTGGRLLMTPMLGASSLEGMRFFGLPNTFVGILLGVTLWGTAGLVDRGMVETGLGRWSMAVILMGIAFIIGFGGLGANLGGFITAMVTYLLFLALLSDTDLSRWRIVLIALATVIGTGLIVLVDAFFSPAHSGKAAKGGVSSFLPLIARKLTIHLGEIGYFLVPAFILILAVLAAIVWMRRPGSFWESWWKEYRPWLAALFSLTVGAIVALMFNDTGIAMLAAMMLISVMSLSYYISSGRIKGLLTPVGDHFNFETGRLH